MYPAVGFSNLHSHVLFWPRSGFFMAKEKNSRVHYTYPSVSAILPFHPAFIGPCVIFLFLKHFFCIFFCNYSFTCVFFSVSALSRVLVFFFRISYHMVLNNKGITKGKIGLLVLNCILLLIVRHNILASSDTRYIFHYFLWGKN